MTGDDRGDTKLMRTLSLPEVVLSGIGVILGAGIYALIGEAAATAGNALWLSFVFSALIASFTGLSYMELSSMFPRASAEYEYTRHSFGSNLAFMTGIMVILSGIIGASTVALGFSGYFRGIFDLPVLLISFVLLLLLSLLLFAGIRQSAMVAIVFTLIEAGGLVGIILIGLPYIGSVDYFYMPLGMAGVFQAAALIFFAYQGFEEIVKLSEETKDPERTIPLGLIIALSVTILLYVLVSVSVVSISGWEAVAGSENPFAMIAGEVFDGGHQIFTVIALFATANTVLLMLLSSSRIIYGMAKEGRLPGVLGRVHERTRTPAYAVFVSGTLSLLFLSFGNIRDVASVTNFTLYFTFTVINASVIVLRFSMPDKRRPFKVPLSFGRLPLMPVMGIAACLFFLFQMDFIILLTGVFLTASAFAGAKYFGEG